VSETNDAMMALEAAEEMVATRAQSLRSAKAVVARAEAALDAARKDATDAATAYEEALKSVWRARHQKETGQ
jgi:hypothetical protein